MRVRRPRRRRRRSPSAAPRWAAAAGLPRRRAARPPLAASASAARAQVRKLRLLGRTTTPQGRRRACGCYMRGGVCAGRADRHGAGCVARKACADRGVRCALAAPPWWPRGRSPAPRRASGRRDALQTRDGRASARGDAWGRRWACRRRVCAALPLQAHLPAAARGRQGRHAGRPPRGGRLSAKDLTSCGGGRPRLQLRIACGAAQRCGTQIYKKSFLWASTAAACASARAPRPLCMIVCSVRCVTGAHTR